MAQYILITYKNGTSINIDVPNNYYKDKYPKKSAAKLNKIFVKDYQKFVAAINSTENSMLYVNKYLAFSNANISCKDVLSIDLKIIDDDAIEAPGIQISGTPNQICLNLNGTSIEELITKINNLSLIENIDKLIQKFLTYFNKSNVEFTIKTAAKKKAVTNTIVASKKKIESATNSSVNLEEPAVVDSK
jgi:hypothetical protein